MATLIVGQTHRGLSITWNKDSSGAIEDLSLVVPATGFQAIFLRAGFRYVGTGTFALLNGGNTQGLPNLSYVPSAGDYAATALGWVGEWTLWIKATWPDTTVDFAGPALVTLTPAP